VKGPRADVIALAAIASATALGIGLLIARTKAGRADALTAVPAESFLVLSIDVPSFGQSVLAKAIVGEGPAGSRPEVFADLTSMKSTCGFDPLPHLRSIVVALPEGGARGDFGVAASGDLAKGALASCASALIAKRGGEPKTREEGTFTVISDGRAAKGENSPPEVAFRDGGPFLAGRGVWLTHMMEAAEGRAPSLATSPASPHRILRSDLASQDADAEAIVATATLPQEMRRRLQREMAREARDGDQKGTAAMEGVLSVSSAGAALHAGREHDETRLTAVMHCDSDSACEAVSTFILHERLGWSGNLAYRIFGLGGLIDNLEAQRQGTTLFVKTHAPADDLAKMLDRVLSPSAPAKPRQAPQPAPEPSASMLSSSPASPDAGR
jgi:hypothetical protein